MPPVFLMPPAFLMPPVFLMTLVHGLLACVATSGHGSISAPMLRPGRSKPEFRRLPTTCPLTLQCLPMACPRLAHSRCVTSATSYSIHFLTCALFLMPSVFLMALCVLNVCAVLNALCVLNSPCVLNVCAVLNALCVLNACAVLNALCVLNAL